MIHFRTLRNKLANSRLSQAALLVAGGILAGRALGFVRTLTLSAGFGVSREADLAVLAISIPDLLTSLFVGGAIGAVLIPEFNRVHAERGSLAAHQLIGQSLLATGVVSVGLTIILTVFGTTVTFLLAPGMADADQQAAVRILRLVFLSFPFCTLSAVCAASLQAKQRVLAPAFSTVVLNTFFIFGIVLAIVFDQLMLVTLGVLMATAARFGVNFAAAWREGLLKGASHRLLRLERLDLSLSIRYLQAISAIGLAVGIPFVARAAASYVAGGIAALNYSMRILDLLAGILGAVLTMVLFPRISKLFNDGNLAATQRLAGFGTVALLLITIPAVVAVMGCSREIVTLLFGHGSIDAQQLTLLAQMTQIAFLALPSYVLGIHARSIYHAFGDTRFPLYASLGVTPLLVLFVYVGMSYGGLRGLMCAVTAVHWLSLCVLTVGLATQYRFGLLSNTSRTEWLMLALTTAAGCIVAAGISFQPLQWYLRVALSCSMSAVCLTASALVLRRHLTAAFSLPRKDKCVASPDQVAMSDLPDQNGSAAA